MELSQSENKPDDAKITRLKNVIDAPEQTGKGRKKQPYSEYSKKELWQQLETIKAEKIQGIFSADAVGNISLGVFLIFEKILKIPYTQVNVKSKKGFDETLSYTLNYYVADKVSERTMPILLTSASFAMLTLEAITIKRKAEKKEDKKDDKIEKDTADKDTADDGLPIL